MTESTLPDENPTGQTAGITARTGEEARAKADSYTERQIYKSERLQESREIELEERNLTRASNRNSMFSLRQFREARERAYDMEPQDKTFWTGFVVSVTNRLVSERDRSDRLRRLLDKWLEEDLDTTLKLSELQSSNDALTRRVQELEAQSQSRVDG